MSPWQSYLRLRGIEDGQSEPMFPVKYGVEDRDEIYKNLPGSASWPGALGIDSVLIAYDALLASGGLWSELCLRAMLHGGDNDSTGNQLYEIWPLLNCFLHKMHVKLYFIFFLII